MYFPSKKFVYKKHQRGGLVGLMLKLTRQPGRYRQGARPPRDGMMWLEMSNERYRSFRVYIPLNPLWAQNKLWQCRILLKRGGSELRDNIV